MAFIPENAASIDEVGTYSDPSLTQLVEDLTPSIDNVAEGVYESSELDYTLYTPGSPYWCKIVWTPVGAAQQVDSFEMRVYRLAQPAGSAPAEGKDCDSAHVQTPAVILRLGLNIRSEGELERFVLADGDRFADQFTVRDGEAEELRLVFSSARAGAPLVPKLIRLDGEMRNIFGLPTDDPPPDPIRLAPMVGYHADGIEPQHMLGMSRNMVVGGELPASRKGSRIVAVAGDGATVSPVYGERVPVDAVDGSMYAVLQHGEKFFDLDDPLTTIDSVTSGPYGSINNPMPRSALLRGLRVWCDGVDHRTFHFDAVSGTVKSKVPLVDPGNITLAPVSGGNLPDATRFVRIRWKDAETNTESGPSNRTSGAPSVVLASPNSRIQVTIPAPPPRATHVQVQTALLDTPESYEIHEVVENVGGGQISDSSGWVSLAGTPPTDLYISDLATSGDFFEFRTTGAVSIYRHSNPPQGAALVTAYKGHAFYATLNDVWLVWSEADNPEHHYANPTNPHEGFNTIRGEELVDSILTPPVCLCSTLDELLLITRSQIISFQGSMQLQLDQNTAQYRSRDLRPAPIGESRLGGAAGAWVEVDGSIYYTSPAGPSIYRQGQTGLLDPHAIESDWDCRDKAFDHRVAIGYDPRSRLVLFSFVSNKSFSAGVPDKVLAWSTERNAWCAPLDLAACSFTQQQHEESGIPEAVQLFYVGPYGAVHLYGYGTGDGADGSDPDCADLVASSWTGESVTITGKAWVQDQWKHLGVTLTDRQSGQHFYRVLKSNSADTLEWNGAVTNTGSGWIVNIGAFPSQLDVGYSFPGQPFRPAAIRLVRQDQVLA